MSMLNMMLGTAITAGKLTLKEVVFNASGTFTMPSGVVDNKIIVGCTGGGGGGCCDDYESVGGGNGSGRVVSTLTMSSGQTATVIVGAGGITDYSATSGGTSSFTGATSCVGGARGGGYLSTQPEPTNGGGEGNTPSRVAATASNCPAALTLQSNAVDGTTGLWKAKSYAGAYSNSYGQGGGGGCYGYGAGYPSLPNPLANSGAGARPDGNRGVDRGGSGKVVVWYYTYE